MKFIIFFIYMPFVCSELHTLMTTYTGIRGQNLTGTFSEFFTVTILDEQQIDNYDRDTRRLVPKQDWMKKFASTNTWKDYTKFRKHLQQIYKNNINVLMQQLNQSDDVHTYQRIYGCDWDDETEVNRVFDNYGYDGEDFITLDIKNCMYIASIQQAEPTVEKWNNDREQLKTLKNWVIPNCVQWLKEFVHYSNLERKEAPKVSLLQKNPDYYVLCHVTGFQSRNTTITWRENGQTINDSSKLVKSGKILPNGDGTFQKNVTLYVLPDDWMTDQYICVVKHKNLTKTIQKTLTKEDIIIMKKPASTLLTHKIIIPITVAVIFPILMAVVICTYWTQIKHALSTGYRKVQTFIVAH